MGFRAFFRKEWYASRRNVAVLLVLLVVLPGSAALGTAAFQQTIPEDIPIGVAPQDEAVTQDELAVIRGGTAMYAAPQTYDSTADARGALEREEVYLVIEVPHGLFDDDADVTVTVVSDQRITPFQDPANYTESMLRFHLSRNLPADVSVTHERIGTQYTLSEYLVPTALLVIVMLYAFIYLPLELHRERTVFERVELTSRIESAVAAKIAFHGVLLTIPIITFQVVGYALDYRIDHFNPDALAVVTITFVYVSALSAAVMFATRLKRVGIFLNMALMASVFTMSSFIYPVGFFSSIRKEIALSSPSYYSMVITRSTIMKELPLGAFADAVAFLVAFTVATLIALQLSVLYYRRTT